MASNESITDRAHLIDFAYATPDRLRKRIRLYDFQVDPIDLPAWVLDHIPSAATAHFLDVGCGPGRYLEAIRSSHPVATAFGCDLSFGMAREAALHSPSLAGDSTFLPFSDDSFDCVIAAHMLYHVPDIDATLREIFRVTRSGGNVAVVLNGVAHLRELFTVLRDAVIAVGGKNAPRPESPDRIKLRAAEPLIARYFASLETFAERRAIVTTDSTVIADYVESMEATFASAIDVQWSDVVEATRTIVSDHIANHGAWHTSSNLGMILARKPRT